MLCDLVMVTEAGNARGVLTLPAGMTSNGCVGSAREKKRLVFVRSDHDAAGLLPT